ncbi:MAG: sugar phosphate nucleotidyltransferase, partial [Plesiomonas sp.]
HVRQGHAKGLGHAVLCAKPLIGDEPFAVVLPDVIIDEYDADLHRENLAEMLQRFDDTGVSQIMVEPVPQEDVSNYGVADCGGAVLEPGESHVMHAVVEKPAREEAPSNLAIVGRYVLPARIWALLEKTPVGAGDEIQLTDAIAALMQEQSVDAYHIRGRSHDCGSKLGYMQAFVEYGMRHSELGEEFSHNLKALLAAAK